MLVKTSYAFGESDDKESGDEPVNMESIDAYKIAIQGISECDGRDKK